ncbi:MAG: Vitamin B12 transporter BtuB [Steroidobacteraceae bacterium]|nr:Vitamin B12 transporter BtuB [Steroidobacteraceae bacterium]
MRMRALVLSLLVAAVPADIVWADELRMTIEIPAQSLGSALRQLANQADLQLVYETDLAAGVNSPEVRGELSVRSALDRLLQGTGLRYQFLDERTVAVSQAPPETSSARGDAGAIRLAQTAASAPAALDPGTATARSAMIEEVIVTARKREETLQSVPIAATAFTASDLERQQAYGLEDLNLSVPNLTVTKNTTTSNGAQVYIRGVGRDNVTWNEESGVAIYVDDVYLSQQVGGLLDFLELERIEVLRGPQGTLYGRNATGGAVKFVTKRPQFESVGAAGDVTFGSFHRLDVRGTVGGEVLEDRLAVKLDFVSRTDDGYVRRPDSSMLGAGERLNGTNRQTGRLAALYRLSDRTELYFAGDITYGRDDINSPTPVSDPDGDGVYTPVFGRIHVADPGVRNDTSFTGYTLNGQVSVDLDWATFRSISAFRSVDDELRGDMDGLSFVPLDFEQTTRFETFTQEFQLTGKLGEQWDYVAGLFFLTEDLSFDALNVFLGNLRTLSSQETKSYAAYVDSTYDATDRLSLSVGARYTRDEKDVAQSAITSAGVPVYLDAASSKSWSEFSPRASIDFQWTPAILTYVSWGTGFKAGAVANGRPPSADQATLFTNPEETTTVEIGLKSQWLDNRVRVNVAYFDTDYENLQASFRDPDTSVFEVVGADAEIKGFEVEAIARVIDPLTLYLTAGWLDPVYTDVPPGHPAFGLQDQIQLKQVPKRSFRFGVEYRQSVAALVGEFVLSANYLNSDEIPRDLVNNVIATTPAYDTIDAQLAYEADSGIWRVALAGENLNGEEYWSMGTAPFSRFYVPQRTWSLNVRYRP